MSLPQLEAWARRAREIKAAETAANHRRRSLRWRWNLDESWLAIRGRLPADQGAVVVKALERVAAKAPPLPSGVYEDFESRAADALVELAGISVGRDSDADRATVVMHIDPDALVGRDGAAELDGGVALDPAVARRLCCDARIQVMAHDRDGAGFGVGRTSRTVPPWLNREIRRRDRGCRFPGCSRTLGVAAHHLDWWGRDGGPTDDDNLILLCRAHHRLVHEGKWSIRGHPAGALTFIRPDGRVFEPGSPALRPEFKHRLLPEPDG